MSTQASELLAQIPQNLYSADDLKAISAKASAYKKAMKTASNEGLLDRYCETKARMEVMEQHLSVALVTMSELMVWHIGAVEQINNLVAGREASRIEMPTLEGCAGYIKK